MAVRDQFHLSGHLQQRPACRLIAGKCVGVGSDCALSSIQRAVELCAPTENCMRLAVTATAGALQVAAEIAGYKSSLFV